MLEDPRHPFAKNYSPSSIMPFQVQPTTLQFAFAKQDRDLYLVCCLARPTTSATLLASYSCFYGNVNRNSEVVVLERSFGPSIFY